MSSAEDEQEKSSLALVSVSSFISQCNRCQWSVLSLQKKFFTESSDKTFFTLAHLLSLSLIAAGHAPPLTPHNSHFFVLTASKKKLFLLFLKELLQLTFTLRKKISLLCLLKIARCLNCYLYFLSLSYLIYCLLREKKQFCLSTKVQCVFLCVIYLVFFAPQAMPH